MIPKDKALKLIKIYMYVCKQYDENLKYYCQRYSNNSIPVFTDQEILTIYLFVGSEQRYTRLKEIHKFAKEYLLDWFPGLTSYQTFVYRLNRMVGAITELLKQLTSSYKPDGCDEDALIVDSMPIMTCTGRNRTGKVAPEIADKGYCSTKNQYYYGMKLHLVGMRVKGHIPFPHQLVLSPASENDLTVFKRECVPSIAGKTIFADKIYRDNDFWSEEGSRKSNELLTPIKAIKGVSDVEKQRNKAADDLYSAAVSSVREPVEAFFSWLNEKTNIQRANKCRSTAGLLIHTLGKLDIAFIFLIFNY